MRTWEGGKNLLMVGNDEEDHNEDDERTGKRKSKRINHSAHS
jgi:hypothetical protein